MLDSAYLTTSLVLGGAALIVPATRNLLLGSVAQDWLADELEFDHIGEDQTTVYLKDGTMFRVFALKGQPYETKPFEQQNILCKGRSDLIHQIGETETTARFIGVKRQQDVSFDATWPSPTLEEIGKAEQGVYKNSFFAYWYVILENKDYSLLEKASNKVTTILSDYGCRSIQTSEDSQKPCYLTGIINYLVCGDLRRDLLNVSDHISANIPASDLSFQDDGTIECQTPTKQFSKVIAIRSWPEILQGMIISEVMAITGDIEVTQISVPLHNEKTVAGLMRKANEHKSGLIGNAHFAAENKAVAELLSSNQATLFETQFQIIARSDNLKTLDSLIKDIAEVLSRRRVVYSVETKAAAVCWFNRMPGQNKIVRPLRLLNENIAALWPFQYSPRGQIASPFGDKPIRLFKTPTGQSYSFQFHVSDKPQSPGNYLLFGPTGGGKSTLIMHLLGGLAKFQDVRNYIFDSKEGARYMIETLGGIYQSYENLALNPLDVLINTKTTQHQINLIIRAMLGESLTDDMDNHINHAIDLSFELQPPYRTFNEIYEYAFPRDTPIRKAFAKWVTDKKGKQGLYSHVFNATNDQMVSFLKQSYLVGINMNEALKDPVLGAPVVAHIATSITQAAKNSHSGFSIFVDEAANLLRNKGFRDVVLEMYREYRKLNGLVGLAFQDPAALLKFSDHEGIINNTQTLIFLPNSLVRHDDLEPFNLNEEQKNFITTGGHIGGGRQVLIVKRDMTTGYDESAILDVDLSNLGDALRFYKAGSEANANLDQIKEQWGQTWLNHI